MCGGTELEVGGNWAASYAAGSRYVCRECLSAYNRARNEVSREKNAESPFAHLTDNQKGSFAEDLAMHFYHLRGYYCYRPTGDGSPSDFIAANGRTFGVQVKLAYHSDGRVLLPSGVSEGKAQEYLCLGASELFVVHPNDGSGWRMPMQACTTVISPNGEDKFAQYRVKLPLWFQPEALTANVIGQDETTEETQHVE